MILEVGAAVKAYTPTGFLGINTTCGRMYFHEVYLWTVHKLDNQVSI